jgi:hypothetical protein
MKDAVYDGGESSRSSPKTSPRTQPQDLLDPAFETFENDGIHPQSDRASVHSHDDIAPAETAGASGIIEVDLESSLRTRLLSHRNWDQASGCGSENCNHGTFSPRPTTFRSYGSISSDHEGFGGRYLGGLGTSTGDGADVTHALLGDTVADGLLGGKKGKKMSTTRFLALRHGIKSEKQMQVMSKVFALVWELTEISRRYLAYYIPIFNWIRQYKWAYLRGDLVAALTMASFYIPMALSYASNLGHLPAINGLYSFVINPLVYAILGTCPLMVVGPEAAGSLLTGEVVRDNIRKGTTGDDDGTRNAEIAGIITCMAGGMIFAAGLFRLGFLDSVLSRPFLRGFISAIGIVIFVDQLIPEMGLSHLASEVGGVTHGSCIDKIGFIFGYIKQANPLTCAVSFGAFAIIMVLR